MFLISINFKLNLFLKYLKKIYTLILFKKEKNYTHKNEIIDQYIPEEEIKNLIQEDLPFVKNTTNNKNNKIKFILPSIKLLSTPSKSDKKKNPTS